MRHSSPAGSLPVSPCAPDAAHRLDVCAGGVGLQALALQPREHCGWKGELSTAGQDMHQKMDWLCPKVCPKVPCSHHLPSPHCPYRSPLPTHPGTPLHPHPPVSHRSSSEAGCNAAAREARHWMARLRTPARLSSSSGSSACEGWGTLVPMHHWHSHAAPAPDCSTTSKQGCPACCLPLDPLPPTRLNPAAHLLEALWIGQQRAVAGGQLRQDVQAGGHHIRLLRGDKGKAREVFRWRGQARHLRQAIAKAAAILSGGPLNVQPGPPSHGPLPIRPPTCEVRPSMSLGVAVDTSVPAFLGLSSVEGGWVHEGRAWHQRRTCHAGAVQSLRPDGPAWQAAS